MPAQSLDVIQADVPICLCITWLWPGLVCSKQRRSDGGVCLGFAERTTLEASGRLASHLPTLEDLDEWLLM